MAPKYKLNYFNITAKGEPIRLLFHAAGVEFEDNRVAFEEWGNIKPDARRFPLSQMPTLEVDGKVMTQSGAIGRYLAKEFGLYGDSSYDQALIDQVYETLDEISNTLNPIIFREKDEEMKKKKFEEFFASEQLKRQLTFMNNILKSSNGGNEFFIGKKLSLADLMFFAYGTAMVSSNPKGLDGFPEMSGLLKRVGEMENIKKYVASQRK